MCRQQNVLVSWADPVRSKFYASPSEATLKSHEGPGRSRHSVRRRYVSSGAGRSNSTSASSERGHRFNSTCVPFKTRPLASQRATPVTLLRDCVSVTLAVGNLTRRCDKSGMSRCTLQWARSESLGRRSSVGSMPSSAMVSRAASTGVRAGALRLLICSIPRNRARSCA